MNSWDDEPAEKTYFGLTAGQLNLTSLAVVASVARAAVVYLGGLGTVRGLAARASLRGGKGP